MPELSIFSFNEDSNIRVVDSEWFVAKDVCAGLDINDHTQAVRLIDKQLKKAGIDDPFSKRVMMKDRLGRSQNTIIVNEVGLNMLVMQSRKESAIKFKYWLASEVIPSLHRTGKYEIPKVESLTPAQQRHIQNRVAQLVREQVGTTYKMIWAQIKNHFKVGSYKDIPAARYPDVCAYLKCQPIFLSKTEDEQLFLDDLSAEHSAELKKALESQGIERLLVVIEKGRLALVKNIQGFSIVDAQGYRTVRRNMQMLNKQFNWLSGDEGMESLDLEFESIH